MKVWWTDADYARCRAWGLHKARRPGKTKLKHNPSSRALSNDRSSPGKDRHNHMMKKLLETGGCQSPGLLQTCKLYCILHVCAAAIHSLALH